MQKTSSRRLTYSTDHIFHGTDGDLRRVLWSVGFRRDADRATRILAQLPAVHPPSIPREHIEVASACGGNEERKGCSVKAAHLRSDAIMAAEVAQHSFPRSALYGVIIQEWRNESADARPDPRLRHHLQATHHPHSTNLQGTSWVHPDHPARQMHHPTRWAESCPLAWKSRAVWRCGEVSACDRTRCCAGGKLGLHLSSDHPQDHRRVHLTIGSAKQTVQELRRSDLGWGADRSGSQHW